VRVVCVMSSLQSSGTAQRIWLALCLCLESLAMPGGHVGAVNGLYSWSEELCFTACVSAGLSPVLFSCCVRLLFFPVLPHSFVMCCAYFIVLF